MLLTCMHDGGMESDDLIYICDDEAVGICDDEDKRKLEALATPQKENGKSADIQNQSANVDSAKIGKTSDFDLKSVKLLYRELEWNSFSFFSRLKCYFHVG